MSLKNIVNFPTLSLIKTNFMISLWNDATNSLTNWLLVLLLLTVYVLNIDLETLRNEFCITNVLCQLLFCSRSPVSSSQCRICSRLFVKNANDFVSSIKYHFSQIFVNKFSNKETESLFAQERKMTFKFDILYSSEKHDELGDSEHNRCMNSLIVKKPVDLVVVLSELYVRILTNIIYSISNDIL